MKKDKTKKEKKEVEPVVKTLEQRPKNPPGMNKK